MFLNIIAKVNLSALDVKYVTFLDMAHARKLVMHMQIAGTYFAYLMSNTTPGTYTSPCTSTRVEIFAN